MILLVPALAVVFLCADDPDLPEVGRPLDPSLTFTGSLTALGWLASIEGYIQTPSGGQPGTSSHFRPETGEIGLDGLHVLPRLDARVALYGHELHLAYTHIDIDGDAVLHEDLTSQGEFFPAGSSVKSGLQLPLFQAGYRADWLIPRLGDTDISLAPEIGVIFTPFHYTLDSPSAGAHADRAYTIAFPYLGLHLEAPFGDRLTLEFDVAGSAGITHTAYAEADVRLAYAVILWERLRGELVLGLEGAWLFHKDSQTLPNEVNVRIGSFSTDPWAGLTFGVRVGF